VVRGEALGVIALDRRTIHPFSNQDAQLVSTFAGHVAMAIHNARLFEVRKAYEQELVVANRHKETLLQELHHRVKNNMQLISSLLRIRASTLNDPAALSALQDVEVRILAMAAVHERLYEPSSGGRIDLGAYLHGLTKDIVSSHAPVATSIAVECEAERIETSVDVSVPVGLLVSELVLNVVKHAFPVGAGGRLSIEVRHVDNQVHLSVRDNGRGLDSAVAEDAGSHLGLHLVHTLADQLQGSASVFVEDGTRWEVVFPLPRGKPP
jgi:two-component sensor histidine kinase